MYQNFVSVYDQLAQAFFYDQWMNILRSSITPGMNILDLGCGSGTLLEKLKDFQCHLTGVDISSDMLVLAQEKMAAHHFHNYELYESNMSTFTSATSYDMIISTCDSINYLSSLEEVKTLFGNIYQMLNVGGTFCFDMHSDYRFATFANNWLYADADEEISVIWETLTEDKYKYEHVLTFFQKQSDGLYDRYDEVHEQYFHKKSAIVELLERLSFRNICCVSDFTDTYSSTGERNIYYAYK